MEGEFKHSSQPKIIPYTQLKELMNVPEIKAYADFVNEIMPKYGSLGGYTITKINKIK